MHERLFAIVVGLALALSGPALAQDAAPRAASHAGSRGEIEAEVDALRERIARIGEQVGAEAAEPALAHARRAIGAAREARRRGEVAAADRALAIADAALVLADRLAAQRRARLGLDEARRRERDASAREEAARDALSRALVERARVLAVRDASEEAAPAPAEGEGE